MKALLLSLFIVCISVKMYAQNCNCENTLKQIKQTIEQNYAGWFDKVTEKNEQSYQNWSNNYFAKAKNIKSDSLCYVNIREWIGFFKDKHLAVRYTSPPKSNVAVVGVQNSTIKILKSELNEVQINDILKKQNLDPIEGIYESSSYKLGIIKVDDQNFHAVVLKTSNENWKVGEVKLIIKKNGTGYDGVFFDGNKEEESNHKVKLVDNILDFDIVFYEKTSPLPAVIRDLKEYEILKDDQAPKLSFTGNDLAIFTFPNFYGDSNEQLAYLLKKYEVKLKTIPNWIIDLRNNDGGDYLVGMQLMNYIYTKPIIEYNTEMRMTENNFNLWYNSFVKYTYENASVENKKQFDDLFTKMKSNYGKMYNRSGKLTDTLIIKNPTEFPQKVGILINENTVSSGELFTILAKQSDKVKVFGSNSGGMMDYGNIVTYKTDCPNIRLRLPLNRYLWLNTGYSVDDKGIIPDEYLKEGDLIKRVYEKLNK